MVSICSYGACLPGIIKFFCSVHCWIVVYVVQKSYLTLSTLWELSYWPVHMCAPGKNCSVLKMQKIDGPNPFNKERGGRRWRESSSHWKSSLWSLIYTLAQPTKETEEPRVPHSFVFTTKESCIGSKCRERIYRSHQQQCLVNIKYLLYMSSVHFNSLCNKMYNN